jgi:uncharacterized membrane protein
MNNTILASVLAAAIAGGTVVYFTNQAYGSNATATAASNELIHIKRGGKTQLMRGAIGETNVVYIKQDSPPKAPRIAKNKASAKGVAR